MQLSLRQIVPIPLRDKVNAYNSGIWQQNVDLYKGDKVFIQAPSGTGKTTLIHVLYGLRTDFEGLVYWDAYKLPGMNVEDISKLRAMYVSVIFQDLRLFPELTTWENLELKRHLTGTASVEEVETWLARLGMKEKRDSLAGTLSYGEQQRVAIIRSLLQPFEWLLMDEPFSHLDHANIEKAAALISEVVQQNGAGMIMADLDDNEYFPYTRKICL
jgi:putative ABC transport system ATP-binding protein